MNLIKKDSIQINPIYLAAQEIILIIQGWQNFDDASLDKNYIFKNKSRKQLEGEILLMSPFRPQLIQLIRVDCHAYDKLMRVHTPSAILNSQATRRFLDSPSSRGV